MFDLFRPRPVRRGLNSQEADLVIKLAQLTANHRALQEENEELKKELAKCRERYHQLVEKFILNEGGNDD